MAALPEALIERALAAAVARGARESPRARELLVSLAGRRLQLQISGAPSFSPTPSATPWGITLESTGTTLRAYRSSAEAPYDARIIGAPLSLLALGSGDPQAVIQRGAVRIEGDAALAQEFRELVAALKPDPEALLGEVVGRSGAHLLLRALRGATRWTRGTVWTGVQNLGEYLAHERGELVSGAQAEHFLRGVDDLREQLDRVAARMAQLERQTRELAGGREPT
jgi:ubiquinone biosynthesis protein UbiJ